VNHFSKRIRSDIAGCTLVGTLRTNKRPLTSPVSSVVIYEMERPMGLIRRGEESLAIRYLAWHYRKMNLAIPDRSKLQGQAKKIVDEAHRIARETGGNVISIIREMINDLKGGRGSQ